MVDLLIYPSFVSTMTKILRIYNKRTALDEKKTSLIIITNKQEYHRLHFKSTKENILYKSAPRRPYKKTLKIL